MEEDKFDTMYEGRFDALQKKYEAEIAIAKSELDINVKIERFRSMGIWDHFYSNNAIDDNVSTHCQELISNLEEFTLKILSENTKYIKKLAKKLLETETLSYQNVKKTIVRSNLSLTVVTQL